MVTKRIKKLQGNLSFNLESIIKSALRKSWSRSMYAKMAIQPFLDKYKIVEHTGLLKRVFYKCFCCKNRFTRPNIHVDHIIPVVGPEGFQNWDVYIRRLFCSSDNYQLLCEACHKIKTAKEREGRKQFKQQPKANKQRRTKCRPSMTTTAKPAGKSKLCKKLQKSH